MRLLTLAALLAAGHAFQAIASNRLALPSNHLTERTTPLSASTFDELGLCDEALEAIEAQVSWRTPTPIQQLAIPQLLGTNSNNDEESSSAVWCEAPTGSGKTASFVLPLLQKILEQKKSATTNSNAPTITSLIVCPTRELAQQVGLVVQEVASYMMPCNIAVITGGDRRNDQLNQLADWVERGEPIDVVVATPGRLVDVLTYYSGSNDLAGYEHNNFDENGENQGETRLSAADAALERRLLQAMDDHEKDNFSGPKKKRGHGYRRRPTSSSSSLRWEKIRAMGLDREDGEGRAQLVGLLQNLQFLVLDEADRVLSRAFASDMDAVLDLIKPQEEHGRVVPTFLFSATFPKLMEPRIESVLSQLGHTSTVRIACANSDRRLESDQDMSATLQKRLERVHRHAGVSGDDSSTTTTTNKQRVEQIGPASTIDLRAIRLEKRDRTQALKFLLQENREGGVLVFVSTRYAAEHVSRKLKRSGIRSHELHGKLDQDARNRRLQDLQSGKIEVLIATDLASRGLDVEGLACVVNYDLPRSTADFVHRVGRTGRAGRHGNAITFLTATTEGHYDLIEQRHLAQPTPREFLPGFEVDEENWQMQAEASRRNVPGVTPSDRGLAYDRMFGGIKGHRKSKKDRLREEAAKDAAAAKT